MNKKAEKLVLAFAIIGVLVIGSIVVLATLSSYDSEKSDALNAQTTLNSQGQLISETQAASIAQKVASGTFSEIELKQKRSDPNYIYYEVEFESGNTETEVKVHAISGAVLGIKEGKSDELSSVQLAQIKNRISEEQARSIALSAVPNGRIISVEAEEEHGKAMYSIELDYNGRKTEVEVDMISGAVLDIELEDSFEDDGEDDEDEDEDDDEEDEEDDDDEEEDDD